MRIHVYAGNNYYIKGNVRPFLSFALIVIGWIKNWAYFHFYHAFNNAIMSEWIKDRVKVCMCERPKITLTVHDSWFLDTEQSSMCYYPVLFIVHVPGLFLKLK